MTANIVQTDQFLLLQQLLNAPGAPHINCREIIHEINNEFGQAKTEDHRVALLTLFKSIMDKVEGSVGPEDLDAFRDARQRYYNAFIVKEALVGENACVETLYAITQREIDAVRMSPNDSLRKTAEMGMAAPHLSRAELVEIAARQDIRPASVWKRLLARICRG